MRSMLTFSGVVVLMTTPVSLGATTEVVVGMHDLLPNLAHQPVTIHVTGVPSVLGLSFNAQIGPGQGGGTPSFDGVDLIGGSVFAANHGDPDGTGSTPQLLAWSIWTADGTVAGDEATLATLYFSTEGLASGSYTLSLENTLNGPTRFYDDQAEAIVMGPIADGMITIVPGPNCLGIVALVGMSLLPRRRPCGQANDEGFCRPKAAK